MRCLLLLTLAIIAWVPTARAADPERKPNIVFCFADDWGRYASAYTALDAKPTGNSVVKPPNIDSVAARGCCSATRSSRPPRVRRAAVRC
jgi:hypothetical protein